jgi:hypothetical protein
MVGFVQEGRIMEKRKLFGRTLIIFIAVILGWLMSVWTSAPRIKIDTTHPEFPTGIIVSPGKYHVVFHGGWNLNRHEGHPEDIRQTLIGPEGIPDWPPSDPRPWAFQNLPKMGTGLLVGSHIMSAERDFYLEVKPEWLKGRVEIELVVLINDLAGTHHDNGPGLWFTRYFPMWKKIPYSVSVVRLDK